MFTQRLWMIPVAHWVGLISLMTSISLLVGGVSLYWLVPMILGQVCGSLAVSVGLHRYFTHGAFETNRFWHTVLALYSTLTVQGSQLGWAAAHMTHHVYSDLPGDPHYTGISYLWRKQYNQVPMVMWRVKNLIKDPVLAFTHRYALLIILAWTSLLLIIGMLTGTHVLPLLFMYLAPLGLTHMIGAIHQVTSHMGGGPRNLTTIEWLLPACGEWQHKFHHDYPRAWCFGSKWYHLDLGALFILAIRK